MKGEPGEPGWEGPPPHEGGMGELDTLLPLQHGVGPKLDPSSIPQSHLFARFIREVEGGVDSRAPFLHNKDYLAPCL
jgi:hypothetical protein